MIIFYGLGNESSKYYQTKHNIGRLVLEKLAKSYEVDLKNGGEYFYGKTIINSEEVYFLYSAGFMNTSGEPLYKFIKYFKLEIKADDLLVIMQDDSDQIEEKAKFLQAGGSAGHHGINSIYKHLPASGFSSDQVWRLKIGIRPAENKLRSETFVLSKITAGDEKNIQKVYQKLSANLNLLNSRQFSKLQTLIHTS